MAYLRKLEKPKCQFPLGCTRKATTELVNNRNGSLGVYCAAHGTMMMSAQKLREKAAAQSMAADSIGGATD